MIQGKKLKTEKKAQEIDPAKGIYYLGHEIDDTKLLLDSTDPNDSLIPFVSEKMYYKKTGSLMENSMTYFPDEDIVFAELEMIRTNDYGVELGTAFRDSYIGIHIPAEKYANLISVKDLFFLINQNMYSSYVVSEGNRSSLIVVMRIEREKLQAACVVN